MKLLAAGLPLSTETPFDTEEFECPELVFTISGQGFYQKIAEHPNYEKIKEYIKGNSSYNQD